MYPADFEPKRESVIAFAWDSEPQSERGQLIIRPSKISDCGQLGLQLESCDVSDHSLGGCQLLPSESQGEVCSKPKVDVTATGDDVSYLDLGLKGVFVPEKQVINQKGSIFTVDLAGSQSFCSRSLFIMKSWPGSAPSLFLKFFSTIYLADSEPIDFTPKLENMFPAAFDSKPRSERDQLIICPSKISDCCQLGLQLESCDVSDHNLGGCHLLPSESQGEVYSKPKVDVTSLSDDVSDLDFGQKVVLVPEKQVIKRKEPIFTVYLADFEPIKQKSLIFTMYSADSAPKWENMFPDAWDSEPHLERGQLIICPSKISDCSQLALQLESCDVSDHNLGSFHLSQGEVYSKSKVDATAGDDFSDFDSGSEWHTTDTTYSTFSDDSLDSGSSDSNAVLTTASVAAENGSDLCFYRNWKDLIPDVLCMIVKSLPLVDNIHFGAVCTNWYSAAAQSRHPPAPQPPFLVLPSDGTGTNDNCQFFDLSYDKFYKIRLPQLRNRRCLGSSQGKLIYIDERADLHVFDPITDSEFDLPSITTFDNVGDPLFDEDGNLSAYVYRAIFDTRHPPRDYSVDHLIKHFYSKVIICPKTSAAIAICHEENFIAFCMPGDKSWTMIDTITPTLMRDWPLQEFWDIVFYKDVLYTLTGRGTLGSLQFGDDFKAIKVEAVGPDLRREDLTYKFTYLVEAGGELLQVWRRTNYEELSGYFKVHVTLGFKVFKMNWGSMLWEEMEDLGEYALFLGLNDSFSLSTRDFPELKPNCIYFTDDDFDKDAVGPRPKRDAGVFNLEDGTIEPCYPSDDHFGLDWPHLIWFTPKGLPSRHLNVAWR